MDKALHHFFPYLMFINLNIITLMKKITLILFFAIFTLQINAQIILNESDFANAGEEFIVNANNFLPTDQILLENFGWDFSSLELGETDTISIQTPYSTGMASSFPQSNIVMEYSNLGLAFIDKTSNGLDLTGLLMIIEVPETFEIPIYGTIELPAIGALPIPINFLDYGASAVSLIELPAEEGDTYSNSTGTISQTMSVNDVVPDTAVANMITGFVESFTGGIGISADTDFRFDVNITIASDIENENTLHLPVGEFNALKQNLAINVDLAVSIVSGFVEIPIYADTFTESTYNWYAKDEGVPVLSAQLLGGYVSRITYKNGSTYTKELTNNSSLINVFPNPSNGEFVINSDIKNITELNITNVLGAQVYKSTPNNVENYKIDISHLEKGIYFVNTITDERLYSMRVVIN